MKSLIFVTLIVISQWAAAQGGTRGNAIDKSVLARLERRGLQCLITEVYAKRVSKDGGKYQYGPSRESAILPSHVEDGRLYLDVPDYLEVQLGYQGFDFKELKSLSKDYLLTENSESGIHRRLEIDFRAGVGTRNVNAEYGGWTLNKKTKVRQRAGLENCRLL